MGGGTGSPGNRRESLDGLSRRDSSGRRSIQVPVDRSLRFSRANDIGPPQMHIVYRYRGGVRVGVGGAGAVESREGREGLGDRTGRGSETVLGPGLVDGP
jgi:hypothetical protein